MRHGFRERPDEKPEADAQDASGAAANENLIAVAVSCVR